MSPLPHKLEHPLRHPGWRARRSWRRTVRRIIGEHAEELRSRLETIRGLPISGLATTPAGTLRVALPGWTVTMAGVASGAHIALTDLVEQRRCYVSDTGQYGPFWWLVAEGDTVLDPRRAVILGSRLVLTTIDDGHPRLPAPDLSPLRIPC
jgi:hypothetical protein